MATTLRDIYGKTNKSNVKTLRDVYGNKTEQTISSYQDSKEVKKDYNKGGLLEGIGYTLGKVGTGAFGVLEGIWDYAAGGIADIFGADEWAEKQFATNLTGNWNQDLDEWYNPSGGMKLVGDVSSGIGSTLVGVAAGALTGGTAAPVVAGVTMGVGAAGSATSEAYQKTGTLGGKEYLYGALSGATEGALESATGVAGKVSARLFAKETAKSLAKKSALKGIFSTIASDFAGEAFEEGMSEFLTPIYQRITQVDPNAKNATIQEIGYSALVGGLSGALMSGIGEGISTVQAINRGNEISKNPEYAKRVVSTAEQFANASNEVKSKSSLYSYMDGLVAEYNARANSTGELSLQQKKVLAQMERAIPVLTLEPTITKSKAKILADADRFVEYVNARNIVDQTNGKVIKLENGEALKNNEALLTQFAVMDAVGSLLMDSDSVYSVVTQNKNGEILQEDYLNFQKNATTQQKSALKEIFGVDVDSTSYEDFIAATKKTNKSAIANIQGGIEARASAKRAISRVNNTNEKVDVFNEKSLVADGTKVYKTNDGKIYAVIKNGEGYYLYNGKDISKKLSKEQLVQAINALNGEIKGKEETQETSKIFAGKQIKQNGVTYVGIDPKSIKKDVQKASIIGAEILAKSSNLDIVLYESYRDKNGKIVVKMNGKVVPAPNGMFRDGNRIYLDINAGVAQEGTILYTLSHEVGHYIRQWNPRAFKSLADFLFEHYEGDISVKTLIDNEIAGLKKQYKAENKKIPSDSVLYDMAYEDVVCNAMSKMFADKNAYIKLAELKKQNKSLWAKIGEAIKAFLDKLKKAIGVYSKYALTDRNAAITKDMATKTYNKLQDMYIKAFVEADANYAKHNTDNATAQESNSNTDGVKYSIRVGNDTIIGSLEESKNLVALHNLSESNLLRVIELGGFPMPSIAVTTTELPHENYGDVTVVFGRETIDPESDSRNVVYDRDAWTPTTPTVDVKLSNQGVDSMVKELQDKVGENSAYKREIYNFFDSKYRDNNGDYILSEYDYTKESLGEKAIRNSGIVAAYLSEKGVNIEPVYTERGFNMGWATFTRQEATDLFNFVGITKDITRDNATQEQRDSILERYIEYQAKKKLPVLRRFRKNPNMTVEEAIKSIRKDYDDGHVSQLFFMAEDFFNENRPKDIYDEYATIDKMQAAVTDKQDFYNWFWDKVEGTFEKKGIDNDSDVFDRKGNRKSFEQRHFAYTAANIVKAMSKGDQEGKVGFGITAGALAAKLAKRFDSIEDIHEAKQYLALVSEEDLKAFNDKTYELYDELVTEIAGISSDFMRDSSRRDDVGDILGKCAGAKPLTIENIKRIFDKETKGYNLGYKFNNDIAEQTLLLFESLKHIPTTYFEAKPRRVVGLDEIKKVLLPKGTSEKLVKALEKNHIEYTEYKGDNSRSAIIKDMDDVRFSTRDSAGNELSKEQQEYFKDSKVRDENGNLMVVYHGTRKADFTEFKRNINFYTDSNEMADSYAPSSEMFVGYLNIKKPFIIDAKGERWSRIPIDDNTRKFLEQYGASTFKETGKWRTSPADIASAIEEGIDEGELDYDGIIIKNVDDTGRYWKTRDNIVANDYITFKSNQFKNADNKAPTSDPDIRYSTRDFASQVDDVLNGKFARGNAVYVGATPKILQDVGLNGNLPMLTTAKHIKKAVLPKDEKLHNHGLTVEQLKSIPEKIANPVMIMDSLTEANCVVVVTDMTDSNGAPIVVAVKADGKGMYNNVEIMANFMLSYYPKANFHKFIDSNIAADSMLFIDKEKSRELSNQAKVQFFGKLEGYDFNTIIRKAKAFVNQKTEDFENSQKNSTRFEETTPIKGADKVMTELPNDKVTLKDVISGNATKEQLKAQIKGGFAEQTEAFKVTMTNAQASVERVAEENGIKDATAQTNYIRAGKYAAQNAIEEMGGQYNLEGDERLGDSLGKILKPIYKANEKDGKTYADFELYLLHWHNIERYEAGKPVFNRVNAPIEEQVTSEDSKKAIAELDKKYPNFKKVAEKVWKFNDNNLQLSVESGMYSQEYADNLREMYPHYVPTFREEYATTAAALMGKNNVWVNNAKKAAKGSAARILPVDDMMAAQTIQKTTSARINSLLVKMLEQGNHEEFKVIATEDANIQIDDDTQVTTYEDKAKNTHQVTFYHNGKKVTAQVSRLVFKGIDNFRPSADMSDNVLINTTKKLNTWFKKGVTSLNPFFSFFKNPIRDMQDALLYTKYGVRTFLKNYKRARKEIANNGKYWQEAKAAGITSSSVYDYQKGIEYKQTGVGAKAKQFASKIENASNAIEMSPRLAEYISAREAGLSVKEALLQAQDVTTNFGRGGEFAKKLNSTISPFLNPAIQGFSKMWRAYTGEDGKKAWISLIIKSLILGIGATALNDILNDDDEDYENLSDYVKEQNYVIAIGDGNFLKLPKGRVAGVFGSAFLRGKRYSKGEEEAWDDYLSTIISSVTPVENFTRTIFSPITDAQTNTTWYGGTIESQKWNDTEPKNRYDASTSKISIWLGSVFNYSPLKIDYLLEQYTGIVGDLVLPATSTQAESGIITQNMLANSTTNSKWSTNFYSTLEKYTYKKTSGDLKAKGVVRYLNSINSTISDMYNQQRTIQADKSIADSEKLTQSKIIQATINTLMQEAIGNAKYIYDELGKYNLSTDDAFERSYLDCISVVMGEEYALQTYNKDVYAKATKLNKLGVDYATYYDFYFDVKDIDSDKNNDGSTIAGSKKAKVINYVMSQNLSTAQKLVLIMAQGYTIADGDVKGMTAKQAKTTVAKYITSLNLTREEKTELSEMLGFTVKNGKILLN